jgi:hypothetical protein
MGKILAKRLTSFSFLYIHIGREVGWGRYMQNVLPRFLGDQVPDPTSEQPHALRICATLVPLMPSVPRTMMVRSVREDPDR